jgi:2-dehydro-3-deoxy-D-arabinonate dehydratase
VIGSGGGIIAATAGNDLSAGHRAREPAVPATVEVFRGCFAFRPVLVTATEIPDPAHADLAARSARGAVLWKGEVNTREIRRRCPQLVAWLCRDNPIPVGTVLSTGTGILVPDEHSLHDGDLVEIELERVGTLRNRVRKLR